MAFTVERIYNLALSLIDSVDETGAYSPDNPDEDKRKAMDFITILQAELISDDQTPTILSDLGDELSVSDNIAIKVIPYGLAAHLLVQEDPNTASFFNARYDELKYKKQSVIESIQDVYNVTNGMC